MTEREFLERIREIGERHGASRIVLFGSRARGTASPYSDFDLAVFGVADARAMVAEIDALPTLFSADVIDMETCRNPALIREVDEHGVLV